MDNGVRHHQPPASHDGHMAFVRSPRQHFGRAVAGGRSPAEPARALGQRWKTPVIGKAALALCLAAALRGSRTGMGRMPAGAGDWAWTFRASVDSFEYRAAASRGLPTALSGIPMFRPQFWLMPSGPAGVAWQIFEWSGPDDQRILQNWVSGDRCGGLVCRSATPISRQTVRGPGDRRIQPPRWPANRPRSGAAWFLALA